MHTRRVRDVMVKEPVTVAPGAGVAEAFEIMVDRGFRHLPVVDGDRVVGIISDRDVFSHMPRPDDDASVHGRFMRQTVREIMTRDPITVLPNAELAPSIELMLTHKVSALVVADGQKRIEGIVTMVDVASTLIALLRGA